jgi:hypothetical protein
MFVIRLPPPDSIGFVTSPTPVSWITSPAPSSRRGVDHSSGKRLVLKTRIFFAKLGLSPSLRRIKGGDWVDYRW